jgi:hypothetical protein
MPTRQKTVEFGIPPLASAADNALTAMPQITVSLPESGKTFREVWAIVTANGTATAQGNVTTRRMECRLGAAAFTAHTNSNLYTGSGEDIQVHHAVDLTAHFTANWTGTSMTFDTSVLFDGTATGIAWTNICAKLFVTYDFDDTSATQIKTVYIPLAMPSTALATTKPGTALATIPNLSTELPEASKTFRNWFVTVQGNQHRAAATTDLTLTFQLDSTTVHTTGIYEGAGATDSFFRYIWHAPTLDTAASMGFFCWANATEFDHQQAWLTVTYEFDATASNRTFVSVMLPMEVASPMGGTAAADFQRATRELWIQEPGTITTRQVAFYPFWDQAAAIAGLNMRIGTSSFLAYSDVAATLAGSNAAMVRNDSAFTLARGRNEFNFDVYRTDTTDLGLNVSGFWIVNYTADKPALGYAAANRTVRHNMGAVFDGAASILRSLSAFSPAIASPAYFINSVGINYQYFSNTTGTPAGVAINAERLVAEGGLEWEPIYTDISQTDPETGLHECYATARSFFRRWPGDPGPGRVDLEQARRYRAVLANGCLSFDYLDMLITLHNITFVCADSVTGFTGTVTLSLHRAATGEKVAETTRAGDGAFSFDWYDNTEEMYVVARDSAGTVGRSENTLAAGAP